MTDRQKIIKALTCLADDASVCHSDCPYYEDHQSANCYRAMAKDALVIVEKQKAMPVTKITEDPVKHYSIYHCPRCDEEISDPYGRQNSCRNCGQKLKWDCLDTKFPSAYGKRRRR